MASMPFPLVQNHKFLLVLSATQFFSSRSSCFRGFNVVQDARLDFDQKLQCA